MSTPTLQSLQKSLSEALDKIEKLEKEVSAIRRNTNTAINGHTSIIECLIGHTNCRPPQGGEFLIVRNFDVGP